jgi:hypothetical protein
MDDVGQVDDEDVWKDGGTKCSHTWFQRYSHERPHLQCLINTLSISIAI